MGVDLQREADERLARMIRWVDTGEGSLRTHLDEWAAYHFGGELLSKGGRQIWLNNPCPWTHWHRLGRHMDWHTPEAAEILRRGMERDPAVKKPRRGQPAPFRLIVEHAVPVNVIGLAVRADPKMRRPADLREFLLHHFRRGVLTSDEDKLLNAAGWREAMPAGWQPWGDAFARYRAAGLKRADVPPLS